MPPISGNLDEHGNFHGYTMLKVLPSVSCIKGRRCQLDGCRFQSRFNIADLKWQVVEICNMRLIHTTCFYHVAVNCQKPKFFSLSFIFLTFFSQLFDSYLLIFLSWKRKQTSSWSKIGFLSQFSQITAE